MGKLKGYADRIYITCTESGANTLTYQALTLSTQLEVDKAIIIHKIEYSPGLATLALIAATGDELNAGLSVSNTLTDTSPEYAEIIDKQQWCFDTCLTTGQKWPAQRPFLSDYSNLPNGGIIVPMQTIYLFVKGTALGGAATVAARIWYSLLQLTGNDFSQLAQAFRVLK